MQPNLSLQENSMATARIPAITQKQVVSFLVPRPRDSHKGQFGKVAIIGGNNGMIGAAILAGRGALKTGAGCVHVGLLAAHPPGVDMRQPELMLHPAAVALQLPGLAVIAIGCGMGQDLAAQKVLHDALKLEATLVLDADALNILALRPDLRSLLLARKNPSVITPHPGEAAHLLGTGIDEVQADRTDAVQKLAAKMNCSVVLKGAGSLCITSDRKTWLNTTGNPGMSSAGMGDVLSGMIAAFIAQGLSADHALLLAVHLHGAAGDALAAQQAAIGMTASEVAEWSRWLLNQWIK
jgi:ADP-dependent NAD(P)H-hydrate dehydratase / NAD(P)H-hydrate epimerase